jgi:hypothetical protein
MRGTAQPGTLTQIEVMRVLAMSGIFLYHVWSGLPEAGGQPFFGPLISHILSQGHVGVLLFNMITGFVLTLPYAGPSGRPLPRYTTFLRQRFLRICPNYYLSLLFWTGVAVIVGGGSAPLVRSLAEHLLFVHTFDPAVFFDIVPAYLDGIDRAVLSALPMPVEAVSALGYGASHSISVPGRLGRLASPRYVGATPAWLVSGAGALSVVLQPAVSVAGVCHWYVPGRQVAGLGRD